MKPHEGRLLVLIGCLVVWCAIILLALSKPHKVVNYPDDMYYVLPSDTVIWHQKEVGLWQTIELHNQTPHAVLGDLKMVGGTFMVNHGEQNGNSITYFIPGYGDFIFSVVWVDLNEENGRIEYS